MTHGSLSPWYPCIQLAFLSLYYESQFTLHVVGQFGFESLVMRHLYAGWAGKPGVQAEWILPVNGGFHLQWAFLSFILPMLS
jgi:hypothetical protein